MILFLSSCNENIEQSFADYDSFKKSTLRNQSWFPSIVFSDAYNLREIHNIDNNNVFGKFEYQNMELYDSLFLDKGQKQELISSQVFKEKVESINLPKKPAWFIDIDSAEYKTAFFDDYFLVLNDEKNKTIYFIHTYN